MNMPRLTMVSLVLVGLSAWSVAAAADDDSGKITTERKVETESSNDGSKAEIETQIEREGQAPAGDADAANLARNAGDDPECTDDFPSAATQPEALGTDNPNPSGSAFGRGMQDRDRRSRQSLQRGDADVFVFGDDTARGNGSYWSGDQIYGYRGEEDERGAGAAPAGGAVGSVITDQASDGTPHEWSQGQNLIDDNFTQTRDSFDVPGDFYTKEWKVGQPPLAAHPHFRTIYDDDTTDQYYTPWFGSPVTWAPNKMVPVALPAATHEMLTDRQLVTYFTTWRDRDTQSTIPGQLVAGGVITNVSLATAGGNADIYGYRGEDSAEMEGAPRSEAPRDGALHLGSTTLYWDDQDVIGGGSMSMNGSSSAGVYGYVSPDAGSFTVNGPAMNNGDVYLNAPMSTGVSIYGVPSGSETHDEGILNTVRSGMFGSSGILGFMGTDRDSNSSTDRHHRDTSREKVTREVDVEHDSHGNVEKIETQTEYKSNGHETEVKVERDAQGNVIDREVDVDHKHDKNCKHHDHD